MVNYKNCLSITVRGCVSVCRGEISSAPPRILGRPLSILSDTDGIGELCDSIKNQRFRPKARKQDVELYIESCRIKYGCFQDEGSEDDLTGGRGTDHAGIM